MASSSTSRFVKGGSSTVEFTPSFTSTAPLYISFEASPTPSSSSTWTYSASVSSLAPSPSSSYYYHNNDKFQNENSTSFGASSSTSNATLVNATPTASSSHWSPPSPVMLGMIIGPCVAALIVLSMGVCCWRRSRAKKRRTAVAAAAAAAASAATANRERRVDLGLDSRGGAGDRLTMAEARDVLPSLYPGLPPPTRFRDNRSAGSGSGSIRASSAWTDDTEYDAIAEAGSSIARTLTNTSTGPSRAGDNDDDDSLRSAGERVVENPFDHPAYTYRSNTLRRGPTTLSTSRQVHQSQTQSERSRGNDMYTSSSLSRSGSGAGAYIPAQRQDQSLVQGQGQGRYLPRLRMPGPSVAPNQSQMFSPASSQAPSPYGHSASPYGVHSQYQYQARPSQGYNHNQASVQDRGYGHLSPGPTLTYAPSSASPSTLSPLTPTYPLRTASIGQGQTGRARRPVSMTSSDSGESSGGAQGLSRGMTILRHADAYQRGGTSLTVEREGGRGGGVVELPPLYEDATGFK